MNVTQIWQYKENIAEMTKPPTLMCEKKAELISDLGFCTDILVNNPILWPVEQHVWVIRQMFRFQTGRIASGHSECETANVKSIAHGHYG